MSSNLPSELTHKTKLLNSRYFVIFDDSVDVIIIVDEFAFVDP